MKSSSIDSTAKLYPNVELGEGTTVEPFSIIGIPDRFHPTTTTVLGRNSFIGSRCTIYSGVTAGDNFDISDQTTIFYNNQFGANCRIGPKAVIKNDCILGDQIRINSQVFMERVIIHSNVFIGPGVIFADDLHPPCPKYEQCVEKTIVESHVSIGANVTVAPGITIGHHSQIYLGAVVISDVAPYSVMAGNPAKLIKDFRKLDCRSGFYNRPFEWWD